MLGLGGGKLLAQGIDLGADGGELAAELCSFGAGGGMKWLALEYAKLTEIWEKPGRF